MLDLYPFASTSPIYVTIGDGPVRSAADAQFFVDWIDSVRRDVEAHTGWNTSAERESTLALIAQARAVFEQRR